MARLFEGKKVAVVGLGVNNRNLAEFLSKQGVEFEVIDHWQNPDELLGRLDGFDLIFRTPGLPYESAVIQQAKLQGAEISSQTKLFFELCQAKIIGVTGTKGKGTTASLITKILGSAGKKVWLGGNIGRDPFEFLDQINPSDIVVLELSSFQLQDLIQSPHIAVVLAITPDHLNHHKDFEEYIRAKSQILAHQNASDFAVLHSALPEWFTKLGQAKKIFFDAQVYANYKRKLLGVHNLLNIAAAAETVKIFGVTDDLIQKTVAEFEPLPHRLHKISESEGVVYINDSLGTNEDTTIAAISSIETPLILILGGRGKGLGYDRVSQVIKSRDNLKGVVVVGEDTQEILRALAGFRGKILSGAKNMAEIVTQSKSLAASGDTILLSPAATSFDMFKDYADRGDQFIKAVGRL